MTVGILLDLLIGSMTVVFATLTLEEDTYLRIAAGWGGYFMIAAALIAWRFS